MWFSFFQEVFILTPSATWTKPARDVQTVLLFHMTKHQENNIEIASLVPWVKIICIGNRLTLNIIRDQGVCNFENCQNIPRSY